MIQSSSLHSKCNSQPPSPGPSQTGWPESVCATGQHHRGEKPQERFPKSSNWPVQEILLKHPPHRDLQCILFMHILHVYTHFYKNDTTVVFYRQRIVIFFRTTLTSALCFASASEAAGQGDPAPELQPCVQAPGLPWPCQEPSLLHLTLPSYKSSGSTLPPWRYFARTDLKNKPPNQLWNSEG